MPRFSNQLRCPSCRQQRMQRIERKPWMRYFSSSKLYKCENCGARIWRVNRWVRFRLPAVSARPDNKRAAAPRPAHLERVTRSLIYLNNQELQELKQSIEVMLEERVSDKDLSEVEHVVSKELSSELRG